MPPPPPPSQVTLSHPTGLTADAVTDADGAFELAVANAASPAVLAGGLLRLDAASEGCVDSATGLAPPISMGALVPKYEKGKRREKGEEKRDGGKEAFF